MKKIHRFFTDVPTSGKEIEILDKEIVHQLTHVLKIETGEEIVLCNTKGEEVLLSITHVEKKSVKGSVVSRDKGKNEPERLVTLYLAILKKENFETVVQKAVELGIKKIIPIISRRTVKLNLNLERLQKISKEAAEQAGRSFIPEVLAPQTFDEAIHAAQMHEQVFLFEIGARPIGHEVLENDVGIFVGPEGGWDQDELEKALALGVKEVGLGKLTYRAETAAVVAVYHVINL
jgi:16S rRNA (uracil1498-N3)-methyltransferase